MHATNCLQQKDLERIKSFDLGKTVHEAILGELSTLPTGEEETLQVWRHLSKSVLKPDHPFELHKLLHTVVFSGWDVKKQGPKPTWVPSNVEINATNLSLLMAELKGTNLWDREATGNPVVDYKLLHRLSCSEVEAIWPKLLQRLRLSFSKPPSRILQMASHPDKVRWLPDATMNIAACALCNRDPENAAVVFAEETSPSKVSRMTLGQLKHSSLRVAAALNTLGYTPGTAIAICMPMTVSSVSIYLGIVLAGCVVVGIADSFSAAEVAARVNISDAKLIFTQDVIQRDNKKLQLFERITKRCKIPAVVLPAAAQDGLAVKLRDQDIPWQDFLASGSRQEEAQIHMADSSDITNILFSSGTTGDPKAISWTHVTPIRGGLDAFVQMDVKEGEVVAFPTNLGWMMGPWLIYAALLNGAAIALFHGSPLGRAFGEFIQAAKVTTLGTVPSIVRTWRRSSCMQGLDWSHVKNFASTGEASSADDSLWLQIQAGYKPVIELCGGTEIGGGFLAGSMIQPQCPSTFSSPTLGSNLVILHGDDNAQQSSHDSQEAVMGELTIVPPFLGSSQRLLNADNYKVYYQGMPSWGRGELPLRRHGDVFERLPGGYYVAHGRADDTMNLGGIKVSSVELERACLNALPEALSEAAAVAVPEPGGGPDRLIVFVVRKGNKGDLSKEEIAKLCQRQIRSEINPLFKLHQVLIVQSLPRTATNKVMRRTLRSQFIGQSKL